MAAADVNGLEVWLNAHGLLQLLDAVLELHFRALRLQLERAFRLYCRRTGWLLGVGHQARV